MKTVAIPEVTIPQLISEKGLYESDQDFLISEQVNWIPPRYAFRHAFYMVGICTGGLGKVKLNLQEYTLSANTLFAVTPQLITQISERSSDARVSVLIFTKQFLSGKQINSHFLDTLNCFQPDAFAAVHLDPPDAENLLRFFSFIKEKSDRMNHPNRKELIKNLVISALYEIDVLYQQHSSDIKRRLTRKEELHKQFQDMLFRHFREERTVKFYAETLYVSPKYLMEVIKEVSGKTAGELIDEAVILEAKVLLRIPELNVSQVSDSLHFPDQSFFGKFFKKHVGLSPSEYMSLKQ